MKSLYASALCYWLFSAVLPAQNLLFFEIEPHLDAAPFALSAPVSAGSYQYYLTRLEYYVSEIKITHDGGQVTAVVDSHFLVRPVVHNLFELGAFPNINQVESITFSIGVDSAFNHLDPATYPAKHPLGPQDPSMHWGWVSGYRFIAIEGKAGVNFANLFEIHALGDANYKTLTVNASAETQPNGDRKIRIQADYAQALHNIDVSEGLIVHSSSAAKAIQLLDNMQKRVFSPITSSVVQPGFEGRLALTPNPAAPGAIVGQLSLPPGFAYQLRLTDLPGREIASQALPANAGSFRFDQPLPAGMYLVQLWQNGRPVAVEKLWVR